MNSPISKYNDHRREAILSISLLMIAIFVLCYSVLSTEWVGTPIVCFAIILLITKNLIQMIDRSNDNFAQFINNISNDDFSSTTSHSNAGISARKFSKAQSILLEKFRKLKAERSAQHEYLHQIVEHVDTALLCFDEFGRVEIINKAAKDILRNRYVSNISKIDTICPELTLALHDIKNGENLVLKVAIGDDVLQLMLTAKEFRLIGKYQKLVTMQNIQSVLDAQEIESWQKLIKVMTHEIMNSITPIVSLSNHLEDIFHYKGTFQLGIAANSEQYKDIVQGIGSIASRSQGLLRFVQAYRSVSNLPRPALKEIQLNSLFEHMKTLLEEQMNASEIRLGCNVRPESLCVIADLNLLEQIILNLLSNATDAVNRVEEPHIELLASRNIHGRVVITVRDNGCGISKSFIDDIFTPFFTTKESGTGVGLSLSRQLARLNNANLSVQSTEGRGSSFQLLFF